MKGNKPMKKFGKFIFGTLSVATLAAGAYYVYKNFFKDDLSDDFDEFDDDFDEFEDDFVVEDDDNEQVEAREYVSIPIDKEDTANELEEADEASDVTEKAPSQDDADNQTSKEE